jgi:tetratricopeptide (TPR) repeat protein
VAIYEQTKLVKTEAEVTELARECAKVIPDNRRSQVDRDYAASLLAWALNRRGELRNETAARHVKNGQLEQASALDKLAEKDFATSIEYGRSNWRTHHNYAISLAMSGDYSRSIDEFTTAIELKPEYANAYFNRGELYFELKDFVRAIRDYTQAIELEGNDPQYYNSRGHCRFMLEMYDDALVDYRRAAELGKDSAAYQTDLADAYQFLGQWEAAASAYKAAVAVNSKYARAFQNASWLMATCPDSKIRNPELALAAAKRALELSDDSQSARGLETLATATAAVGRYEDAAGIQKRAIEAADEVEENEMRQRLALFERGRAYVQPIADNQHDVQATAPIRTASGNSDRPRN